MADILGRAFDFKTRKRRAKQLLEAKELVREKKFKAKIEDVKEGKKNNLNIGKGLQSLARNYNKTGIAAAVKATKRKKSYI